MSIEIKTILVETHHSIKMIKRHHESLRRIYLIIIVEMSIIDFESILQMSFKIMNDSIELDDLISILLVFEAYSKMTDDVFSSTITQRFIVMKKTMNEIKQLMIIRRVNDALNTRNKSSAASFHDLSLNSSILMFRENNIEYSDS